jgi:hypothetical protein
MSEGVCRDEERKGKKESCWEDEKGERMIRGYL